MKKKPEAPVCGAVNSAAGGDLVKVRVPRGEDVFVSVNGVAYLLPAMADTEVPPDIAAEYYRSEAAKDRFYETARALSRPTL